MIEDDVSESGSSEENALARPRTTRPAPRDLSDFCLRWSELRAFADEACGAPGLTDDQREIIGWLILLADRTCGPEAGIRRR